MSCGVRVGRLIAHPCGRKAKARCGRCQKGACRVHFDPKQRACTACTGALAPPVAKIDLEEFGDPLDFAPEVFRAFHRRAAAPDDELAGVDS